METTQLGLAVAAKDPAASAAWFAGHLGFEVLVDLGWYTSTRHPGLRDLRVDFVGRDGDFWPGSARGRDVSGTLLALVVADVDAEHARLTAEGCDVVLPLVTEPWGQRRFQVAGPDGVLLELVQHVEPDPEWLAAQAPSA